MVKKARYVQNVMKRNTNSNRKKDQKDNKNRYIFKILSDLRNNI